MIFKAGYIYHLYGRTFNHTLAFPTRANYLFFINKLKSLTSYADVLCFCLMPDNFHLVVYMPENARGLCRTSNNQMQVFSRVVGKMLGSYARAYNKQEHRRGSLFQPKTKLSVVNANEKEFLDFIHRNPVKAGLVFNMGDWEFSSYREYYHHTPGICNTELGRRLLGI